MKGKYIKYLLLYLLQLALLSCVKETPEDPAVEPANTILYSVTVSQSPLTRVAISESEFTAGCSYIFELGDKLYVEHRDGETLKLYGVLNLVSGEGTGTARFEGELKFLNDFVPEDNTLINATVVGAGAAEGFFQFGNPTDDPAVDPGTIITGVTYPSSPSYTTQPEMVRKYSYFTGSSTYDAKNFNNLTQQSVFLLFSLEVNRTKIGANPMETTVSIKKNGTPVHSVTGVPVTGLSAVGYIKCTAVVPVSKNPELQSAEIWAGDLKCGDSFASDLSLAVNHYYSVERSSLATDWFRVKAISAGTTVTFNYCEPEYSIKYSLNGGETWNDYTQVQDIPLNKDQEICFQGRRPNYKNALAEGGSTYGAPSTNPILWANKKCYIAGNVMTLLADRENLSDEAFDGAFSKQNTNNTWLDIDPNDPLLLPATTLTLRCYKGMFRRCTSLQYAPDLPVETPFTECYSGMFRDCGNNNLKRVRIFLKAKKGEGNNKDDFNFEALGDAGLNKGGYLDKWMNGTSPSTGAIYCHPDMEAYWVNVWTWYGDKNQFANRPKSWSVIPWTSYIP